MRTTVVAYTVVLRRSEIGLRVALGADAWAILADVVGDGVRTVCVGLAIGDAATIVLTRALSGMLYGVRPGDPITIVAVSAGMLVVAAAACAVPAIAAARVDPQVALRRT